MTTRERALEANTRAEHRRGLWNGFGHGLSQAIELAATPILFTLAGVGLDRWLGTRPAFTLGLALFALAGVTLSAYYRYEARSRAEEEGKPWVRR